MDTRHLELFNNLENLVKTNDAFYSQVFTLDTKIYNIYNYRLASYSDFLLPDALECRGVMFEVDSNNNPIRLAAWPISKFFNINENPSTIGLNYEDINLIEDKHDGSLITTFIHNDKLHLKSKGSLFSDQVIAATKWLNLPENSLYKEQLYRATDDGFSIDLEWTAPDNRIVLGYQEPKLIMLHMRDMENGKMVHFEDNSDPVYKMSNWIAVRHVQYHPPIYIGSLSLTEFINNVPNMTGIEGFVVRFKDGKYAKIKTNWYLSLHHTKDSITNPRRLFEAVIDEAIDDLRSMFYDDAYSMKVIDDMQEKVDRLYNHMVKEVEIFFEAYCHLDRKAYAIAGQERLNRMYFNLAMMKYLNKPVDYKGFMKKSFKSFGIKDEKIEE